MADEYKIYLVNNRSVEKDFFLFLAPPEQLEGDNRVYANSNTQMTIRGNSGDSTNSFTIPVQYSFEVGASNKAVALNTRIDSSTPRNIELGEQWQATYYAPNRGPDLVKSGSTNEKNSVGISTLSYEKDKYEADGWYGSQSFGIKTSSGFAGMTWSPEPNETRTLVPKLEFYIATGNFGENVLADWTNVSSNSQKVTTKDFSSGSTREATVILKNDGSWSVHPGKPDLALAAKNNQLFYLYQSHLAMCRAHEEFIKITGTSSDHNLLKTFNGGTEEECFDNILESATVNIDSENSALKGDNKITGTMIVKNILGGVGIGAIVLVAGTKFRISNILGKTKFSFTYSGPKSIAAISALLAAATASRISICSSNK
ncbi:hypothetical protein [Candidatus Nitrosacidococcus sp. I8]|uniref:hypothetical protein n=1 Tax=Candidatus Nitrosacidococcus sp. I8 TaxID=2942908 RepID=UPI0022272258|nr:hypothetical protein [Candidatus Nitrosacidococcus sp. I8]CAH9018300.1 hypothetical protein NURINAE_00845 [Candidatus Nitrosacidococcus sp. I8]